MQKNKSVDSHTTNWEEIKREYVSTKISMREIARKYGFSVSTVSERAKKEGWKRTAERVRTVTEQKYVEKLADAKVSNADKAMQIINKLMDKMNRSIDCVKDGDIQSMKQLVGAMKDLKDIGVFEVQSTKDTSVTVKLESGLDDYAN